MMKNRKSWLTFLITLILPICTFAFQNEPDGFRGIGWGTFVGILSDMKPVGALEGAEYYKRIKDEMKIGDAKVEEILYRFYKGRFEGVEISFKSRSNFLRLKKLLFDMYGKRKNGGKPWYCWIGDFVTIDFNYFEKSESGYISYTFRPIAEIRMRDQKARGKGL